MFDTQELSANLSLPLTVESEPITLNDTDEVIVASDAGTFSCCDVWFNVASGWVPRVTVRLYARLGAARVLVRQVGLANAPVTIGADSSRSGIAISLRGTPCNAFEVTCQASAGVALDNGLFYLQAWHSTVEPSSSGGAEVPETPVSVPLVAATMVGRNETTGELTEIATDAAGRIMVASPLFDVVDKDRLDDATSNATPDTLALRDGAAGTKLASLTLNTSGTDRATLTADAAFRARALDGASAFAIDWEARATSGKGKATTLSGQKGNGDSGGTVTIAGGEGSTPGTHLAGDIVLDLGAPVSNASAKLQINASSSQIATIEQLAAANHRFSFGAGGGAGAGGTLDGTFINIESRSSHVALVSNQDIYIGHSGGRAIYHRELNNVVLTETLDADGATSFLFDAGPTSVDLKQAKKTGTGISPSANFSVLAQDGRNVASGTNNTGGSVVLGAGLVGTGGTGGTGADGKISLRSGASDILLDIQKDPAGSNAVLGTVGSSRAGLGLLATGSNQRIYLRAGQNGDIALESDTIKIRDRSASERALLSVGSAFDLQVDASCSTVSIGQTTRSGNGANAGSPIKLTAQDGQNVAAGTNNSGGNIELVAGAKGAGGSGGANGSVILSSGSGVRLRAEESHVKALPASGGSFIRNWGTASAAALAEQPHATLQTTTTSAGTLWSFTPTANRVVFVEVVVVAFNTTNSTGAAYMLRGCFRYVSGALSTIGSVVNSEFSAEGNAGMNATISTSGTSIIVSVNGPGAGAGGPSTIRWEAYPTVFYAQA
jgi:hypothetical protein